MFTGAGTVLNVATILAGSGVGVLLGQRLPRHTRDVVTDALGLVTLLVAALSAAAVLDPALGAALGVGVPVLVVLGALLLGGITGSLLRLEERLEEAGELVRRALARSGGAGTDGAGETAGGAEPAGGRRRFVEGFVTASLLFCVGPLTVLGSLEDGLGRGIESLALKATLDGFASVAFAASLGWGVAASVLTVVGVQGSLTLLGAALGAFVPEAHLAALTATGGLVLIGVALRLLRLREVAVADLLPALGLAPLLTELVVRVR